MSEFGFTPHIVPMTRGIETTSHVFLDSELDFFDIFLSFYEGSEFVRVTKEIPSVKSVRGTNYVDIGGFEGDGERFVIVSTIDNLVKGAAGQAIQNANLMLGFKEELGLKEPGLSP